MSLRDKTVKLSIITGISIFAGFVFHILLGRRFGASWQLDCFFVALTLFAWFCFLNTFVTALYIPIFNDVKKNNERESLVFIDVVLKWTLLMSIVIVGFVLAFDDLIIRILVPGFIQRGIALTIEINRIIIFALIFFSLSYVTILTLNALYYYSLPALTGLLDPLFNIAAIFILTPIFGIKGVAISYLFSNFCKAAILLIYLHLKTGWRPTLYFYHPKLLELIKKSSKMALSGFVWETRNIITRNFASRLGEGAVTILSYAEKIIEIFVKTTVKPLANVFYSRISEWVSFSKWNDIKSLFIRTVRINVFLSLFIASGAIVFLPYFLNVFFYGSRFTGNDIYMLSTVFNIMLLSFIILTFELYLSRIIFATKRIAVVAINSLTGAVILFISILILSKRYGIYGLALGITLSQASVCLLYYIFVRKSLELGFSKLVNTFSGAFIMAFLFCALGILTKNVVSNNLIMLFVILPIWLILYLLSAKIFLKQEMKILFPK